MNHEMKLGNRKSLFLDDHVIQDMKGLRRVLNQPAKHPGNPILKPDEPWEWFHGTSVLYDEEEGIYKMWYGVQRGEMISGSLAYATSKDGIHWEKPNLGLIEWGETKENNVVFEPLKWCTHGVIKDLHETDPAKKYKMLFHLCTEKMYRMGFYQPVCAAYSPDGIHWNPRLYRNPVIWSGTDHVGFPFWWDSELRRYVVLLRGSPTENRRDMWQMAESEDFINWTERVTVLTSDEKDPPQNSEFYDLGVALYEDIYIGIVSLYHVLKESWLAYHDLPPGMPPWLEKADFQLIHSMDVRNWMRAGDRKVFLPYGPEGSWDQAQIHTTQPPFIVVGDEIWIYYLGTTRLHGHKRTDHDSSIGLAKLRLDGFLSLDAGEEDGVLITKTLTFTGESLVINADAHEGFVRVELLDPFERSIPGFAVNDCDTFTGDDVRHTVTWKGKSGLGQLMQKGSDGFGGVKLRLALRKAKLYSFKFS